ncbi:hypothetical protein Pmani_000459 [Petrolisthes manimaculis]|uniref:C-type lectin domain-containing protein n=1 Tax=Petrolisthes manimaculis TaxID=1843537 RepID=A0AAE1QMF6_9EUCA|nr:hypothetical protein Pmani_000459 [Petrolisthes manimaculis]
MMFQIGDRRKREVGGQHRFTQRSGVNYEHRTYKEYLQETLTTTTTPTSSLTNLERHRFQHWLGLHHPVNTTTTTARPHIEQTIPINTTTTTNIEKIVPINTTTTNIDQIVPITTTTTTNIEQTVPINTTTTNIEQKVPINTTTTNIEQTVPINTTTTTTTTNIDQEVPINTTATTTTTDIDQEVPINTTTTTPTYIQHRVSSDRCAKFQSNTIYYEGSCYSLGPYRATWLAAREHCKAQGGRLAVIDDRLEAEHLGSLAHSTELAWFGLSWSNDTNTFQWVTGDSLHYTNWNHLEGESKWTYNVCVMVSTSPNLFCASGWMKFNTNCYQMFIEPLSWEVAQIMCQSFGAHLLVLNDVQENSKMRWFISRRRVEYFPEPFWVGLKMVNNTDYEWLDGSTFLINEDWASQEPDTHNGRELCVQVTSRSFMFSTAVCAQPKAFICEAARGMPLTTLPPPTPTPDVYCFDVYNNTNVTQDITNTTSTTQHDTWLLYQGFCYKFVGIDSERGEKALGWWDSHVKCREDGGELASIHSLEENYWIMSKLTNLNVELVWIGGKALEDAGYSWMDETPFDFVNWRQGEPNNIFDQEDCISMYTRNQGYWNDKNCAVPEGYVCKRPYQHFYPKHQPTVAPKGYCPSDWIYTGSKCFKIFQESVDIETAIGACKNISTSGNLASIHSSIEQAYLTSAMSTVRTSVWIGLQQQSYRYYWMDQTSMTYTNWALGEPNLRILTRWRELCVEMLPYHEAGRWNSVRCDEMRSYVCQQHPDPSITIPLTRSLCEGSMDHYISYQDGCYRVVNGASTWEDAEAECQLEGSNLISIMSISEAATAWVVVKESGLQEAWLGLRYHQDKNVFKWSNGWPGLYTQWGAGEPHTNTSHYNLCTKINTTDGLWYTESCEQEKAFVCKYENGTTTVPTPDTPLEGLCPDEVNWYDFGGSHCYRIFTGEMPWNDANLRCLRENADLVSIHTQEENDLLHKTVHFVKDTVWIGLLQKRDNYGWSDGSRFDFLAWRDREPTNGSEKCVEMYASDGKWNDIQCSFIRPFICKTKKIVPNKTEINAIRGVTSEGLRQQHMITPGVMAGITLSMVLVVVVVVVVAGYIVYYRRKTRPPPKIDGCYGFDNALYTVGQYTTDEVIEESPVQFYHNDLVDTDI